MDKYCVCGCMVEANTGGYTCPRCLRQYNIKGKQINISQICEAVLEKDADMRRQDIMTMHRQEEEK